MTQTSRTRRLARRSLLAGLVALVLALSAATARAQSYSSGQPVWPAFEGWEKNEDGTFNLVFGYMNDNWSEELDVPVGSENGFSPGPADRGQPTHFLPRRNRFIFRVKVPKDFGDKELVWSLTTQGRTQKAYGSLRLDLLIENIDIMSETGALGAGSSSPEIRADKPPVIALEGPKTRTVKVGQPLALAAVVTDDGIPKVQALPPERARQAARVWPYRPTVAKNLGLHLAWHVYRGAGTVEFSPPQVKTWEDTRAGANSPWAPVWVAPPVPPNGRYTTQVTFTEPGIYVLRARSDDGALTSDEELSVTVTR